MNWKLLTIGLLATLAGVLAALPFLPGGVERLAPKTSSVTVGQALVGGSFELTAHTGERVTDKNFRGRLMLVYFGYTYCPDVCPAGLQVISAALDQLGPASTRIAPIFITVDPERDTVTVLNEYVSSFHKSLTGLTGSAQEISDVARAYRVYFRKVEDPAMNTYLLDHTSFIYLMDGNGAFVTHFPHSIAPEKLAERLRRQLGGN